MKERYSTLKFSYVKYVDILSLIEDQFNQRFTDFNDQKSSFNLFVNPFNFEIIEAPEGIQLELCEI